MEKRTKTLIYIGISPLVVAGLLYVLMFLAACGVFRAITLKFDLDRMLHHTDHQALLAACRSVIREGYRGDYMLKGRDKHPDADKLPKEILALKASSIYVRDDGNMSIEMWGGMSHWGLVACAEDFEKPYEGYTPGKKKLIDDLWFYSDFIDLNAEE